MENDELYEFLVDAVRQALAEEAGGGDVRLHPRMVGGEVIFRDDQGRDAKVVPATSLFKKVTAVRERLRVLEQKINNSSSLSIEEQAEFQALLSRAYGSLTTFNFLFRHDADKFKGTGGVSLLAQLRALGVAPGDALMLHASMRRVGGRAEALLDALEAAVGPEGAP